MKSLALALLAFATLPIVAQAQLRPGEIEHYAQIVKVQDNQMFPVRTVTLTAMVPCGSRVLGGFANAVSENQVEVGVRLASHQGGMFCLAMPRPVEVKVSFHSETPAQVKVLNLTQGREEE